VTGRIVFDDDTYALAPRDQPPRILLAGSATSPDFGADRYLVVGRDGKISMHIRPGAYRVLTQATPQGRVLRTAIVNGVELGDAPLVVGTDALTDVQFVFTRYDTALRGTVKGPSGDRPADGTVVLFPADKARWFRLGESSLGRVMRAANGLYEFSGIPPGDYYVTAIDNFQFGISEQVATLVDGAVRVTVRAGVPLTL